MAWYHTHGNHLNRTASRTVDKSFGNNPGAGCHPRKSVGFVGTGPKCRIARTAACAGGAIGAFARTPPLAATCVPRSTRSASPSGRARQAVIGRGGGGRGPRKLMRGKIAPFYRELPTQMSTSLGWKPGARVATAPSSCAGGGRRNASTTALQTAPSCVSISGAWPGCRVRKSKVSPSGSLCIAVDAD